MEFFNIGFGELLLIGLIALLVFGPERLPELARQAARLMGQLRQAADEVQRTFTEETRPLREPLQDAKRDIDSLARPLQETRREVESLANPLREVRDELHGLTNPLAPPREAAAPAAPASESNGVTPAPESATAEESVAPAPTRSYKPVSRGEVIDDDER